MLFNWVCTIDQANTVIMQAEKHSQHVLVHYDCICSTIAIGLTSDWLLLGTLLIERLGPRLVGRLTVGGCSTRTGAGGVGARAASWWMLRYDKSLA